MQSSYSRRLAAGMLAIALLAAPAVASAQGKDKHDDRSKDKHDDRHKDKQASSGNRSTVLAKAQGIPRGHLPPPGQCRVWVQGTPPGQQVVARARGRAAP